MAAVVNQNEIRSEMHLKASIDKVWSALTTPEGWTGWFSHGVEGKFAVGEILHLDFGAYGESYARVAEMDPKTRFAYQWHPGCGSSIDTYPESELTTVRFTLEPQDGGTKLTMVESGFAFLPEDRRVRAFEGNTSGWNFQLAKLPALVEDDQRQEDLPFDIFRERFIKAPISKVWAAIATPEGLSSWFLKGVEGDMMPGSMATFTFEEGVSGPVKIVERDEPKLLSWLWHPGEEQGCTWDKYPDSEATIVTFKLEEKNGGTEIVVMESGFKSIPSGRYARALKSNKTGWTIVMDMLRDHLDPKP